VVPFSAILSPIFGRKPHEVSKERDASIFREKEKDKYESSMKQITSYSIFNPEDGRDIFIRRED
jgi:hypothetical protein